VLVFFVLVEEWKSGKLKSGRVEEWKSGKGGEAEGRKSERVKKWKSGKGGKVGRAEVMGM